MAAVYLSQLLEGITEPNFSSEYVRIFTTTVKTMETGGLGKYNLNDRRHIGLLVDSVYSVIAKNRTEVTVQDMDDAVLRDDAWSIRSEIRKADHRLEAVEERWRAERERRAAA